MQLLASSLDDAIGYLNRGGEVRSAWPTASDVIFIIYPSVRPYISIQVAILDGTNVSKARRNLIAERINKEVSKQKAI